MTTSEESPEQMVAQRIGARAEEIQIQPPITKETQFSDDGVWRSRVWLIRLNGKIIMQLTGPEFIDAREAARQILYFGEAANEKITWEWFQ